MPSIGAACNFYNEVHALPGWLESASQFFDDLAVMDCGPGGVPSDDGSLDLLRDWGVRVVQGSIDSGFGSVRSQLLRLPQTEFTMILDADERFHAVAPMLSCEGTDRYPDVQAPQLTVRVEGPPVNAGVILREALSIAEDGIALGRRHWFDFSWKRPCENWSTVYDWQLRVLRNAPHLGYRSETPMHEQAANLKTGKRLRYRELSAVMGPVFDHYHLFYKAQEPAQREHDLAIYNALDSGKQPPSRAEFERRAEAVSV